MDGQFQAQRFYIRLNLLRGNESESEEWKITRYRIVFVWLGRIICIGS